MEHPTEQTQAEIESDIGAMILGDDPEPEEEQAAPEIEGDDEETEDQEPDDSEGDDEPEDEVDPNAPEMVEVEWEGQLIEAPKSVAEALMRQSDYTQKTQEVAAQRKAIETQIAELDHKNKQFQFAESIRDEVLKAQQLEAQADQAYEYLRNNVDSLTPTEIEKIKIAIEDTRKERDNLVKSLTTKQTEFQQASEQSLQELRNKGTEVLKQRIPGWGEEKAKQVRDYALKSGFTEAEISNVLDPRQVETLWKASQYDNLKSGVTPAVKAVQAAPSIKARNPMPKETRQKLDLRKKLASKNLTDKQKEALLIQDFGERLG